MHILFIHQHFLTPEEGGSTRHFELAKYLAGNGNKVTVIAGSVNYLTGKNSRRDGKKIPRREIVDGIEVIRTWAYPGIHKSYISRFFSFISFMISGIIAGFAIRKVDIVIACSPQIFTGISGAILAWIKRAPFVFEIRDLWPQFAIETGVLTNYLLVYLAGMLEKGIYTAADFFLVNSPGFIGHLEKFNIPRGKIFLIPNGSDTTVFCPGKKDNFIRSEFGLNEYFVAMYAGAHGLANGLDVLVESAKILKDRDNIMFVLVGDGKEKTRLMELSNSYDLKNIRFIDTQPREIIPDFFRAADVCLAVLQKKGSFKTVYPNKLFDYMASARPVILGIDGSAREVLEKAGAGIFVEPGNPGRLAEAVLELYNDRDRAKTYGDNGRKYVIENFDRRDIASRLEKVLKEITGKE